VKRGKTSGRLELVQEGTAPRSSIANKTKSLIDDHAIVASCAILALDRAAVSRSTKGYFER